MSNTTEPTKELVTKYGTLTLTFLDPSNYPATDRYGNPTPERDRHVLHVSGILVINRVPVRISTRLSYGTRFYENGKELEQGVRELSEDYQSSYNRRWNEASQTTDMGDLPSGVKKTIRGLWDTVVREAYEAAPELQKAGKRARLAEDLARAEAGRNEAHKKYLEAEQSVASARAALAVFDYPPTA